MSSQRAVSPLVVEGDSSQDIESGEDESKRTPAEVDEVETIVRALVVTSAVRAEPVQLTVREEPAQPSIEPAEAPV